MKNLTEGLKRFERHWIRPLVRRLRGLPSTTEQAAWAAEADRLEELLVALLRADLRRKRMAGPDDATALPATPRPADPLPTELDGLLTALLDTELSEPPSGCR